MHKTLRLAVIVGLGFGLPYSSVSQTPPQQSASPAPRVAVTPDQQPTTEQVTKLFEVMRVREHLQSELDSISAMKQRQVHSQVEQLALKLTSGVALTPQQQAVVEKVSNSYWEKARDIYSVGPMIDEMSTAYQRSLSSADVDAIFTFYNSPAGQHLEDMPLGTQANIRAMMKHLQESDGQSTAELANDRKRLTEEYHLTDPDVEAIVAFYDSAPGQHYMNELPVINQECSQMLMMRMLERNRALADEMAKDKSELAEALAPPGGNGVRK